ncbi:MAG TPA: peptide chain release factor 2 [Candidatus Binatia bacterium]|nr:peptide chain release factor 2 [Candidatus Binatia bacterium]
MHDIQKRAQELQAELSQAEERIGFDDLNDQLGKLREQSQQPDLWRDNLKAQDILKEQARLERRLEPWRLLQKSLQDLVELSSLGDELSPELEKQLTELEAKFQSLKDELKFSGPYDQHEAILAIYAGVGGTDAQDWAEMLMRMYVRWAEKHNYQVTTIDESAGDEAGIKSVTLQISCDFVYGKLKGEHGVHRLVRLSPFNADNLRQTSFAKVDVLPKIDKPDEVEIDEKDLRIDVYRSGGHGGQSVNTTDSAVRVTHIPTDITVAIQNERSQLQNKAAALTILRSRLAQLQLEQHAEKISELKGPNEQAAWGNQIRSYVLHPYKQVKDLRTQFETSDPDAVLNGDLDPFINAYLEYDLHHKSF